MSMEQNAEVDGPRGVRRAVDGAELPARAPRRIQALDQDLVNKIAAGEIIVAPVHALKELIENAVDAGSTSLEILVKDGGLKLLQITDNGHGINRDDLPILCERFTTSKVKAFEDLSTIGTYGFRGEALASISHIAHLTVTTRTQESSCAWRAHYSDGKLVPAKPGQTPDPKATAGRQGTQITVEDLFYNIPSRRRAFRSPSEEYAKILDIVGRYGVHCSGVAFSCKKHGESGAGVSIPSNATTIDRIRQIHGSGVANELIKFELSDERWGFQVEGWASNANYHVKRTTILLFINHRAVESTAIKKAVEQTYSTFLPKGGHPFVYLSLDIDPQRVDVNVHPTKREVNFLNEEEIIEAICDDIRVRLAKVDTSRTFMTQSLLPGVKTPMTPANKSAGEDSTASKTATKRPYENNLIRTDSKLRKITSMLTPQTSLGAESGHADADHEEMEYEYTGRQRINCRLTTVKDLRAEVRENMHNELTEVFAGHTFVGIVDERKRIAAIQGGVKLFLVDYGMISNEYFYQLGLTDFGNFGTIRLNPPLDLRELLTLATTHEKPATATQGSDAFDWDEAIQMVEAQLLSSRDMLEEYFSLSISEDGKVTGLPLLIKGYTPSMAKLPRFLLRLGPYVDWTDEKECFSSFLRELASFYVPESLPPPPPKKQPAERMDDVEGAADDDEEGNEDMFSVRRASLHRVVEHVLFPAFKARLIGTKGLLKGITEVANLKGLYRVFERC